MAQTLPTSATGPRDDESSLLEQLRESLQRLAPDALLTSALDRFYHMYTEMLYRIAAELRFRGAERDDLVQEVWLQVLKHLRKSNVWPSERSGLRGWFYTVIRNKARDLARRRRRQPLPIGGDFDIDQVADPAATADSWEERCDGELLEVLLAKQKVSQLNRRLLTLLWIEERSMAEVAKELKLTPEKIKYRQYRIFRKLRAALAVYRGEGVRREA